MGNAAQTNQNSFPWHQVFKYSIYSLLALNVFLFLNEEWAASTHLFSDGVTLSQLIQAFAATIDTAAWVILLLLFELETYVLPDEKIKGRLKWTLHGVRAACYSVIIYAFYGYILKCADLYQFAAIELTDLCNLPGQTFTFMTGLDEFESINPANCAALASSTNAVPLFQLPGTQVITDLSTFETAKRLAWTDIINAGDWLLIVAILEIDVWLQLKGKLKGSIVTLSKVIKSVLYTILFAAAIYWGFAGDFLDFWDASLWILSFIFIELNIFEWQSETSETAEHPT